MSNTRFIRICNAIFNTLNIVQNNPLCHMITIESIKLTLTSTKKRTFQFPVPGNCLKVATQPNTHKYIYAKDDKGALSSLSEADVA